MLLLLLKYKKAVFARTLLISSLGARKHQCTIINCEMQQKNKCMALCQPQKLLHSKEKHRNEKVTYQMGVHIHISYIL